MSDWASDFLVNAGSDVIYDLENGSKIRVLSTTDVRVYCRVEPNDPTQDFLEQVILQGFEESTISNVAFTGTITAENIGEPEIFFSIKLGPF